MKLGDKVVITKEYSKASAIHTVDSEKSGKKILRHATPQEIAAGHRIDKPELEVLEMIDVSPNCEVSEL